MQVFRKCEVFLLSQCQFKDFSLFFCVVLKQFVTAVIINIVDVVINIVDVVINIVDIIINIVDVVINIVDVIINIVDVVINIVIIDVIIGIIIYYTVELGDWEQTQLMEYLSQLALHKKDVSLLILL